jgi:hypothetical protein
MRENYLIAKAVRKASSLTRYSVRAKKVDSLHDDVEYLLLHCQLDVSRLVDMLLKDDFVLARLTDPSYPA